jgi:general secretion pathway protein D
MGIINYKNRIMNRVSGGQGCLQGSGAHDGPVKTLGSSMKSSATSPVASVSFTGFAYRIALIAVLAVFCLSSVKVHAESAYGFYKHGQTAEAREDYDAAFDNYQKAYAKEPKDLRYRAAYYRVRVSASGLHMAKGHKLQAAGDDQGALTEFLHAAEIDPSNEAAQQEIAKLREKQGEPVVVSESAISAVAGAQEEVDSMASPIVLKPVSNEPLTLHMTEDAKVIYQAIGKAAGINILFDPDYTSKRIQVDLNNVSLLDALRIVGSMSKTFWRTVTTNTIMVTENTRTKRNENDEQAVQTFYLANAWQPNDLTDVQTAVRNMMAGDANFKLSPVASQNAIVARGTPDELLLVQKLIDDLDKARAEVVVDIAILEVSKNWERNLGVQWPSSVSAALQTSTASSTTCPAGSTTCTPGSTSTSGSAPTLYDLSHLKATNFAVTVGTATANLLFTDSDTKILQNPRIRATDGQKATMKIGSKIPIATGSYQGGAGVGAAGISSLVNTQFQYQDVGVNIEVTPTVHYDRDVTLKMKIEVTTQSGSVTISGVTEPILSQRVAEQTIRLREGEANILGGIQEKDIQDSWSGIPGLSSIPILRYIFGSKDRTINDDEIVFLVVPHVVRTQSLDSLNLRSIDTGVGTNIDLRHVPNAAPTANPVVNPVAPNAAPVVPARPPAPVSSSVAPIPAQSAEAAGPAALAQMRDAAESNSAAAAASHPTAPQIKPVPSAPPTANPPTAGVSFALNPLPGPVASGATFQVPVVLLGGTDVAAVPLQISYDPAKLALVNVTAGDLLSRDGQAVALVHRDDGPGSIMINAQRPPGAAGVSGAGVVCVLSFQAKAAGNSEIAITHPGAVNSAQQQLPAKGAKLSVQVK